MYSGLLYRGLYLINNILIQVLVALIIAQLKNKTKWYIFIYSNPNDSNFF